MGEGGASASSANGSGSPSASSAAAAAETARSASLLPPATVRGAAELLLKLPPEAAELPAMSRAQPGAVHALLAHPGILLRHTGQD